MNSSMSHGQILTLFEFVCPMALKSLFWMPPIYQDFNTRQHWPVKKDHCGFANQDEWGAQNKDLSTAS